MDKFGEYLTTPIVLHGNDLKEESGILFLPLYMTPLLVKVVTETKINSKELQQRQLYKGLEAARQRWENCTED